jgi:hypothetical protein
MATASNKKFILESSEQNQLLTRYSHGDALKQAQMAKQNLGDRKHKIKQGMYLHSIGRIPNLGNSASSNAFNSEDVERNLEKAVLYENMDQLLDRRQDFAVIEDDLGPVLEQIMRDGNPPSYQSLTEACGKFDDAAMLRNHQNKSIETYHYFTKHEVPEDTAKAYAFAIAFYTGGYSYAINADTTILARRMVTRDQLQQENGTLDTNALLIMYFLIKGLSHIDFYWGVVVRYVTLDEKELQDYRVGEIVTWLQFSSSDKGGKNMSHFTDRNTVFTIASLTGRSIQKFSNCADDEDEVLFLPHSSFLVCHATYNEQKRQNQIYLRQVDSCFYSL